MLKPIPPITNKKGDGDIFYWREKVLYITTFVMLYLGFVTLVFSVYASIAADLWIIAIADVLVYILVFPFLLARKRSYNVKGIFITGLFFFLGVFLLIFTGPYGAGYLWIFAFPVFAGILGGAKASYKALVVTFFTFIAFGVGLKLGWFSTTFFGYYGLEAWIVSSFNFLLINASVTLAITSILEGLDRSLVKQAAIQERLLEQHQSLERAKKEAEENNLHKTAFLANMSHEIRSPMNVILGFSNLLRINNYSREKQELYFDIIQQKGQYMLQLVNDLIDISKIEAGQISLIPESCELYHLFEELEVSFKEEISRLRKKDIQLFLLVNQAHKDVLLSVDIIRLKQIIINLLSNAIKFTHNGKIEFGYQVLENQRIRFFVKDTGIGLRNDDLERIFKRHEQGKNNSHNEEGGAGLGLFITKNLIELMQGEIWVESEINKGSGFYFELPMNNPVL